MKFNDIINAVATIISSICTEVTTYIAYKIYKKDNDDDHENSE